jgi:molybdopterin converting factor subunit 1
VGRYNPTVHCRVLLFAQLADAAARREITVSLPDTATAADAMLALIEAYPTLRDAAKGIAFAVNERYVSQAHQLRDGDVIALIPPVSGG